MQTAGQVAVVRDQVRDLRLVGVLAAGVAVVGPLLETGVLCPLRRATGVPCPLCGLTTGVGAALHGDVPAAVTAHPLAPAAVVLLILAWTPLAGAVVGELRRRPALIAAVLALAWAGRLITELGS